MRRDTVDCDLGAVRSEIIAHLRQDHVLQSIGVTVATQNRLQDRPTAGYDLTLRWYRPSLGIDLAIQQVQLTVRRPDGTECSSSIAKPLLRRATAVLTEFASHETSILRVSPNRWSTTDCTLSILQRISSPNGYASPSTPLRQEEWARRASDRSTATGDIGPRAPLHDRLRPRPPSSC